MCSIFSHKKILILTSASIALYKMLDCISTLIKYHAEVKVVMSPDSEKFITPLSFEALSHNVVLCEGRESWVGQGSNHISYAKWADIVLIAPATANTIAKAAHGIADNIMLSTLLASNAPKLIAPAMNTYMLHATKTQENLATLARLGFGIIPPRESLLACGDEGEGALAQVGEIIFHLGRGIMALDKSSYVAFWRDREVIITGGGSLEAIDEVRYISNHSSGKQASHLALALYMLGAKVSLISNALPIELPLEIRKITPKSGIEYKNAINKELERIEDKGQKGQGEHFCKPILFMAAAIADFAPTPQKGKLKKEDIAKSLILECTKQEDILAQISKDRAYKVGFKAELDSENALKNAQKMLIEKECDMVCLNVIGTDNAFGSDNNHIEALSIDSTHSIETQSISGSKFEVSLHLALALAKKLQTTKG